MNETLKKAVILYATEDLKKVMEFLGSLSKPTLISTLLDLLTVYFNDKNSSKLRELTTLWLCGFEPSFEKLGYNGYRMNFATGKIEHCEVKPQNTENPKKKLNGGGSFNDYTPERFGQDLKENPTVLCSGFANGKLIYIFEFKFECLKDRLQSLLNKRFPNLKRSSGEYLRSASFSFKDYKECSNLRLVYLRENWEEFGEYLSKELINYFKRQKNEKH